jgi:hypothetical protein
MPHAKEVKLWNFSLWNFLQHPICSTVLLLCGLVNQNIVIIRNELRFQMNVSTK